MNQIEPANLKKERTAKTYSAATAILSHVRDWQTICRIFARRKKHPPMKYRDYEQKK
ncbi:MAG: hypothetical protein IKR82_06600 [Bacteroidales bacterium]|nr:hypothetical protein [Bacteroidales bacterium]